MTNRINLDQLRELNPEDLELTVTHPTDGEQTLRCEELPHAELFDVLRDVEKLQQKAVANDVGTVDEQEKLAWELLMRIYKPFNPWLTEKWFSGITERRLDYILEKGIEYQQAWQVQSLARKGIGPDGKPLPPAPAVPSASSAPSRSRTKTSTGKGSTKR